MGISLIRNRFVNEYKFEFIDLSPNFLMYRNTVTIYIQCCKKIQACCMNPNNLKRKTISIILFNLYQLTR